MIGREPRLADLNTAALFAHAPSSAACVVGFGVPLRGGFDKSPKARARRAPNVERRCVQHCLPCCLDAEGHVSPGRLALGVSKGSKSLARATCGVLASLFGVSPPRESQLGFSVFLNSLRP